MANATGHNGYFGLPAAHIALLTDEESLTYGDMVDVGENGGIIEIALSSQTSTDTTYASDRPWIDSETDNGFDGTMRLVNVWGNAVLRPIFAQICGYKIAGDGTLLGTSDQPRTPFALLSESSGNIEGKRICYYKVQAGKPDKNAKTKEDGSSNQPDEFSIVCRPVKLPDGDTATFYENVPADGDLYTDFFEAVRTSFEETAGAGTEGAGTEGNG